MPLDAQQSRDLWNAVQEGLGKLPFFIPRESVLGRVDDRLTRIPASLRTSNVGDVADQIVLWRRGGQLR